MRFELPPGALAGTAGLPDVPREYHAFYRTPRSRRWHSLAGLLLFVVGWGAAVLGATLAVVLYEVQVGGTALEDLARGPTTPGLFLANNVGAALAIPVALVTHLLVFGQPAGWLFSIKGRLRWALLGRTLLVAAVVHLAVLAAWLAFNGPPPGLRVRPETWFLLAVVLLTTPLQAAGEEVAFRGLASRVLGSAFESARVGLLVSAATTTVMFMLVHGARDLPLNVFYACLALACSLVTWRAGGLEAAMALHVVANLTTMLFLPFLGLADFSDRGAGSGGAEALTQAAAVLLTAATVLWQIHRLDLPVRSGPRPLPDRASGS
jgi:uncharacterized protein